MLDSHIKLLISLVNMRFGMGNTAKMHFYRVSFDEIGISSCVTATKIGVLNAMSILSSSCWLNR